MRVSRHASDKLPHLGHRSAQRTHVRSPRDTQRTLVRTDYNPRPQRDVQEIPRDTRVSTLLPLDPPEIVVLPASNRVIDYDNQQRSVRKLRGRSMQLARFARRYCRITTAISACYSRIYR